MLAMRLGAARVVPRRRALGRPRRDARQPRPAGHLADAARARERAPSAQLDVNAFLRQAQEYREWDSAWDRLSRRVTELNLTHSYPVGRVAELTEWVRSGEYDRIVGGSYRKRDEKVDRGGRGRRRVPALPRALPADLRGDRRHSRQERRPDGRLAAQDHGRPRHGAVATLRARGAGSIALAAALVLAGIAAARATPTRAVLRCSDSLNRMNPGFTDIPAATPNQRLVLGRIWLPSPSTVPGWRKTPLPGRDRWIKFGIRVTPGAPVTLEVPPAARVLDAPAFHGSGLRRVADASPELRIQPCPRSAGESTVWTGGWLVTRQACAPLIVRIGSQAARVRLAFGHRC